MIRHIIEMDDRQEENPEFIAKSMREMIKFEENIAARHAFRA